MKNVKTLTATILLGMGLLVGGCGNNQPTQQLVQLDNGKYTMNTGDDYAIDYVKGYSDDQVTNYMMIRVIGKDNNKTVDDLIKCYNNNGIKAAVNIQVIGYAVEYKGNIYRDVGGTHIYEGQKMIVRSDEKDDQKITFDGTFKEYALGEVTKVERDESGHLTHYTVKVIKNMKIVKSNEVEHFEVM